MLLDPETHEMIIELAKLDGAFVVRGDGLVRTAGTFLAASGVDVEVPKGLGARHVAAAAVTARTRACAIAISATDSYVRVFSGGRVVLEMDPHVAAQAAPRPARIYLGREVVGEVVEVGPEVQFLRPGDRVAYQSDQCCATREIEPPCRQCAFGSYALCENRYLPGPQATGGGWSDARLESGVPGRVRVPRAGVRGRGLLVGASEAPLAAADHVAARCGDSVPPGLRDRDGRHGVVRYVVRFPAHSLGDRIGWSVLGARAIVRRRFAGIGETAWK